MRALRRWTLNLPSPDIGTSPPFLIVFSTREVRDSRNTLVDFFSWPDISARDEINSVFVMRLGSSEINGLIETCGRTFLAPMGRDRNGFFPISCGLPAC